MLTGKPCEQKEISVLRDTACSQSIILKEVFPLSDDSSCGYSAVLQGIDMQYMPHPLPYVHLRT